ncbi:hypothetical protein D4M07_07280 [Lactococcus lactis subsp. lactis]|nr:hypothetical protein D4M07_07280 [Lactococcus lactis subsp. lactis]
MKQEKFIFVLALISIDWISFFLIQSGPFFILLSNLALSLLNFGSQRAQNRVMLTLIAVLLIYLTTITYN